ncbi:MAG: lamin tail domain-containing protein [Bacteroidales bacterium]|nr:lamin tail domain-containing protein [Bacteroidales bacterium]
MAQINDDFSDGDFTNDPLWSGNPESFIINPDLQLQLNATDAGESFLSTPNTGLNETEWRFWIKLSFSPSANNYARVYLVSDQTDLDLPLNGYYLQFGESGSDDAIELFRQAGDEHISVCRGTEGLLSGSFEISVKITRNENALWKIFIDPAGGNNFQAETEGTDNEINTTNSFGVFCKYTSSNSSKMYFDNFYVGDILIDTIPPEVVSVNTISQNKLDIKFSEGVDRLSSENINNYTANNNIGKPENATRNESDPSLVHLEFSSSFPNGEINILNISGIKDFSENTISPVNIEFSYYIAQRNDIVINEIMADPSPPVNMPEYEYLELYNTSPLPIDLNNWMLIIGTSEKVFSDVFIEPGEYLIIGKETAATLFSFFGDFYGFSSFSLTNSGQEIILRNQNGNLISYISYSDDWYNNPEKEDGGWSLEQIDPFNPCGGNENWKAANNDYGGTPGSENSVFSIEDIPPKIDNTIYINPKTIELSFDQNMDSLSVLNINAYKIDNGIGKPQNIIINSQGFKSVILEFSTDMSEGIIYTLDIVEDILNCSGIPLETYSNTRLGIPQTTENNDIVINEILFNPLADGVDYVEIYNRSNKIIDLKNLKISSVKKTPPNPPDTITKNISENGKLIFPEDYFVLSKNPDIVKQQFYTSNPDGFIKVESFPSYNNDKGISLIKNKNDLIIDIFEYSEEMQFPLLNFYDGVALERINYNRPANDKTNWHSASQQSGFGTPAFENSQFTKEEDIEDPVSISPEIFSPNADGFDDILNINYKFESSGYTANITIFNSAGKLTKNLIRNELLGTKGGFSWDGINQNNEKANIGIYIIYFEIFDLNGKVRHYKKTCVVGR